MAIDDKSRIYDGFTTLKDRTRFPVTGRQKGIPLANNNIIRSIRPSKEYLGMPCKKITLDMPTITLIALVVIAAFVLTSSRALGDPCSELAHAKSFSFGATVRAGRVVSGEKAFSQVLHLPNPEACFREILKKGNAEGKMYALAGLRELNPAQFQIEAERLKGQRFSVVVLATEQRGVIERQSSESVIKQIGNGVFHRPAEFLKEHLLRDD